MVEGSSPRNEKPNGAPFRIVSGCFTLGLGLLCVFASFTHAISMTGKDALTLWFFFAWGLALALGGLWLIRGRSKGKSIVLVLDRKRVMSASFLAILVVGLLIFLIGQLSIKDDPWWPLILQTMFANLFASLPFMLFDREDHKERDAPVQLDAAGRRKVRRRLLVITVSGGLMFAAGIAADVQVETWWADALVRIGSALLAAGAVLGCRLKKNPATGSGPDPTSRSSTEGAADTKNTPS
jgi:hypothetical protein